MRLLEKRLLIASFIVSVSPAVGGTAPVPANDYSRLPDSDILQAWSLANEACRRNPPACEERDAIDRQMPARGYCYVGDGANAHWSKCGASVAAAAPPLPGQGASRPEPVPEPPATDGWRDNCWPGATPNGGDCYETGGPAGYGGPPAAYGGPPAAYGGLPAAYGGPAFEGLPEDRYAMLDGENWADIHARCVRLRHTIFPTPLEAARARAACRGR